MSTMRSVRRSLYGVYEVKDLQPIFAAYCRAGTIQARWFSGELRAGKGDVVRYVHDGFDRNMETEQVLTVRNGKVLETQTYHNYRRAGLNMMKAQGGNRASVSLGAVS